MAQPELARAYSWPGWNIHTASCRMARAKSGVLKVRESIKLALYATLHIAAAVRCAADRRQTVAGDEELSVLNEN